LRDPARHRLVRYEDLSGDPRATIAAVCAFVGMEPEEEAMLALSGYEAKENSSFPAPAGGRYEGAIRLSDGVDRHGSVASRERAALAFVCGSAADALGYELAGPRSLVVAGAVATEWARPRQRLRKLLG
jgi:hypothetical protein